MQLMYVDGGRERIVAKVACLLDLNPLNSPDMTAKVDPGA